jgi:MYXO-CTERM domain-containing protein
VQQNPSYIYQNTGTYTVSLTVTDNNGLPNTTSRTVVAESLTALTLNGQLYDARNSNTVNLGIATQLRLYRGDGTTPITFTGGVGPLGNGIAIAGGGAINATINVELSEPQVVVSIGEGTGGVRVGYRGFTVPTGAMTHTQTINFYLASTALRGRVRDTRGDPAVVDIGISRSAQGTLYAFGGARDYLAGSGIPASGVNHRTVTDVLGHYYIPIRDGDGGVRFYADIVADTNAEDYLPSSFDVIVPAAQAVTQDVTLGLQVGGASCDDLAAIADVPNVEYATMIQPIWDAACTGCHNSGSGNNGGLNLQTNSYANLTSGFSLEVPGRRLVEPFNVNASFLFEKINCANPQVGTRMRPTDPMLFPDQVLIRSWINQGALPAVIINPPDAGVAPDAQIRDAQIRDANAPDAVTPDAAAPDAEVPDAEDLDAGLEDVELADVEVPDAVEPIDAEAPDAIDLPDADPMDSDLLDTGLVDSGLGEEPDSSIEPIADAGMSGGAPDAEAPNNALRNNSMLRGSCGCNAADQSEAEIWPALAFVALLFARRMRRR